MLDGEQGSGTQIAMEIVVALAKIYDAQDLVPVQSCQVSGVSYKNIGEAGIEFLESLLDGGAFARVTATLNPCGLDLDDWQEIGFPASFFGDQKRVLDAYAGLGLEATCTCTPYLAGNTPDFGDHVAWSESSAISYVNSVIGARSNREGGPAALVSAVTGYTGNYGFHLDPNRLPTVKVSVGCEVISHADFGRLGLILGKQLGQNTPFITGLDMASCTPEHLRTMGASMAASGAVALYHVNGVTPEARSDPAIGTAADGLDSTIDVSTLDEVASLFPQKAGDGEPVPVDLVFFGCPHASVGEIDEILDVLRGKTLKTRVWIATCREFKQDAVAAGKLENIDSKVRIVSDTCIVVCPIDTLDIRSVVTNAGKAFFYLRNQAVTVALKDTADCIDAAITGVAVMNSGGSEL